MTKPCPECNALIPSKRKKCSCGWINKEKEVNNLDGRCVYRLGEQRCPLPGVMSPSISNSMKWYCHYHFFSHDDPVLAEADLRFAHENYQSIIQKQLSWRAKFWKQLDEKTKVNKNLILPNADTEE